jgi:hypothetical protein
VDHTQKRSIRKAAGFDSAIGKPLQVWWIGVFDINKQIDGI